MTNAISLSDIHVTLRRKDVLRGISLDVEAGHCIGVVGPNGSGKSTAMRAVAGLVPVQSGSVSISGRKLRDWPRTDLARHMAYLPQNGEVHWPLKARAVVALGRLPHQRSVVDEDAIQDAMVRCDIADLAERPVNELSGGERARVLLARALATGGKVILADEPFAQLDPQHQIHAMEVLKAEAGRGAAVIVVLHDLALAARYCDRVVVFSAGTIAAQGLPRDVLSSDILRNVFGVDAFIGEHQGAPLVLPIRRRSESAASRGSSPHQG